MNTIRTKFKTENSDDFKGVEVGDKYEIFTNIFKVKYQNEAYPFDMTVKCDVTVKNITKEEIEWELCVN